MVLTLVCKGCCDGHFWCFRDASFLVSVDKMIDVSDWWLVGSYGLWRLVPL